MNNGELKKLDPAGLAFALGASFLWGTTFVSGRYLLREPAAVDPLSLVFYRFIIGGTAAVVLGSWREKKRLTLPAGVSIQSLLLMAFFLFALMSYLLFFGQRYTTATNASLLIEVSPVLIVALWRFVRRDRVPGREWCGIAVSFVGALMVLGFLTANGWHYGDGKIFGDLVILLGAISWVYGSYLAKRFIQPGKTLAVTAYAMLLAGLMTMPFLVLNWSGIIIPSSFGAWLTVLYLAIFPTALGFYCWNEGVARLEMGTLTMVQFMTPVFTIIMAGICLGERVTTMNVIGVILILLGIGAANLRRGSAK